MIEVPVAVKEALKDGRLKKEYIIDVVHFELSVVEYLEGITASIIPEGSYGDTYAHYAILEDGIYQITQHNNNTIYCEYTYNGQENHIVFSDEVSPDIYADGGTLLNLHCVGGEYDLLELRKAVTERIAIVESTIDNSKLVSESVSIDHRLCSSSEITFGTCEGSSIEFQYFNHANIKGKRIRVNLNVYYDDQHYESIPIGFYKVYNCSKQATTGIYKALAYDDLGNPDIDTNIDLNYMPIDPLYRNGVSAYTVLKALKYKYFTNDYDDDFFIREDEYSSTGDITLDGLTFKMEEHYYDTKTYTMHLESRYLEWTNDDPDNEAIEIVNINKIINFLRMVINDIQPIMEFDLDGIDVFEKFTTHSKFAGAAGIVLTDKNGTSRSFTIEEYKNANGALVTPLALLNVKKIRVCVPVRIWGKSGSSTRDIWIFPGAYFFGGHENDWITLDIDISYLSLDESVPNCYKTIIPKEASISYRNLLTSFYEIQSVFGIINRTTNDFEIIRLEKNMLVPKETLYPNDTLYPNYVLSNPHYTAGKQNYSKLWVEENNQKSIKNVFLTYKTIDSDQNETEDIYEEGISPNGNVDYYIHDNWFLKNRVWTLEEITILADNLNYDIQWMPFEMWLPGQPYLEIGDAIEIFINDNTYTSYILQRQLKGIQNLEDTYINGELDIF